MATDLIEQLKQAPALEPDDEDPDQAVEEAQQRPGRKPVSAARQRRREERSHRVPFSGEAPRGPAAVDDVAPAAFTQVQAQQLKVLWDEYEQRQREAAGPKTMQYRCLGYKPDGSLCGAVVEAGTHEVRVKTGEIIRCPHGPDAPAEGVVFDRERFPKYHYELTPMDPIW